MQITTVYLIRHGEVDNPSDTLYGRSIDISLNENGREQIRQIGKWIKDKGEIIHAIYTSPMKRAFDTTRIIKETLGSNAEIVIDDDVIDVYIPALVGHPFAEIRALHKAGKDEYSGEFVEKGNETRSQIADRMFRAFKKAVDVNVGNTIAIVSHGHPLRFLIYRLSEPQSTTIPSMSELEKFDYIQKGQAMRLEVGGGYKIVHKKLIASNAYESRD